MHEEVVSHITRTVKFKSITLPAKLLNRQIIYRVDNYVFISYYAIIARTILLQKK